MTSVPNRNFLSMRRKKMSPDDAIPMMRRRLADFLRYHYGQHASKQFQRDFGAGARTADDVLAGRATAPQFQRALAQFGRPLADFLFTAAGPDDAALLDILHDSKLAATASVVSLGRGFGSAAGRLLSGADFHRAPDGGAGGSEPSATSGHVGAAFVPGRHAQDQPSVGRSARELMALCGRLEQHQDIPLDAADPRHAQLMEVWRSCGGVLTTGFVSLLDDLGLADLVSVYTPDIKIRQIGTGTLFWTDEQRKSVIGKSIFEMPTSADLARAVFDRLSVSVATRQPTNTLLQYSTGLVCATWKRMSFPFDISGCVIGSPALQVAA